MLKSRFGLAGLLFAVCAVASSAYGQMTGNVDRLKADLHGTNVDRAVAAASALGSLDDERARDALLGALQLGSPPQLTKALLEALEQHPDVKSLPLLRHYARHRDVEVRSIALRAIGRMPGPDAAAVLISSLGDSHPMVRARSARLLGERKEARAETALFQLLRRGDQPAATPLGQVGGVEAAKQLAEMIGDLPHSTLAQALGAMLKREDFGPDPLRLQVVKALAKIPGEASVTALVEYCNSVPEKDIRVSKKIAEEIVAGRKQ